MVIEATLNAPPRLSGAIFNLLPIKYNSLRNTNMSIVSGISVRALLLKSKIKLTYKFYLFFFSIISLPVVPPPK